MTWNIAINIIIFVWLSIITIGQTSVNKSLIDLLGDIVSNEQRIVQNIDKIICPDVNNCLKATEEKEQYGPPYGKMIIENNPAFDGVYGRDDLYESTRKESK